MRDELRGWREALTTREVISTLVGRLLAVALVVGLIAASAVYAGAVRTVAAALVATLVLSLMQLRRRGSL
jgi:hypothetical protein